MSKTITIQTEFERLDLRKQVLERLGADSIFWHRHRSNLR